MIRFAAFLIAVSLSTAAWSQEADDAEAPNRTDETCEDESCEGPQNEGTETSDGPSEDVDAEASDDAEPEEESAETGLRGDDLDEADAEDTGSEDADSDAASDGDTNDSAEAAEDASTANVAALRRPFLTSDEYLSYRPEVVAPALVLTWQIERLTPDGEPQGEAQERQLILLPGAVQEQSGENTRIYDFLADRRLDLEPATDQMANTSFYADVRRRLDTFLGLSRGGSLEQIAFGPEQSFDRFWLEAAMGIRRTPVPITSELQELTLRLTNDDGQVLLTANYPATENPDETDGVTADDATEEASASDSSEADNEAEEAGSEEADNADPAAADDIDTAATDTPETQEQTADPDTADQANGNEEVAETANVNLSDFAAPIDLESGESVVFDPSTAAAPIALNMGSSSVVFPDADPETQAQAELFRRWMRHALPLHPDVIQQMRGAPDIPEQFEFFVISPESIAGRVERWTLVQREMTDETRLQLPAGLSPALLSPSPILASVLEAARPALESPALTISDYAEIVEARRDEGELALAFLALQQAGMRFGRCELAQADQFRPDCDTLGSVIAAGLGTPDFEAVFEAVSALDGDQSEMIIEVLSPFTERSDLSGAAARTLVARELLNWAQRNPNAVPEDMDPFVLYAESISIDPHAPETYWYLGGAYLGVQDPLSAWIVFDAGRAVAGDQLTPQLAQVSVFEQRLRTLAPEFFLPR